MKCIQMSTNIPDFGLINREIINENLRKFRVNVCFV